MRLNVVVHQYLFITAQFSSRAKPMRIQKEERNTYYKADYCIRLLTSINAPVNCVSSDKSPPNKTKNLHNTMTHLLLPIRAKQQQQQPQPLKSGSILTFCAPKSNPVSPDLVRLRDVSHDCLIAISFLLILVTSHL
jgi:hypothetical protein